MNIRFAIAITLWLAVISGWGWSMEAFDAVPGESAGAPTRWPSSSDLRQTAGRSTLVLFVHADCECSEASLEELMQIVSRYPSQLESKVLFFSNSKSNADLTNSKLWKVASQIPNIELVQDLSGEQAKLFGAASFGQALLYDATGAISFSGGITSARGHYGDNLGQNSILKILSGEEPTTRNTPVFGCHIFPASKPTAKSK